MAVGCACSVDLFNSGVPGCQPLPDVTVRLILQSLKDSSGNTNFIDLSTLPSDSDIIDLINDEDDKKRLYPFPFMENVTNERSDAITEEFPSGTVKKIRNGVKTFVGQMVDQGATFAAQIESYGCASMGAYLVDAQGNLVGDISTPGELRPIPINMPTWDVRTLDTTDTTSPKVTITFQWIKTLKDGDVGFVSFGDFDTDVDWLEYNGLIDLIGNQSDTPTTTTFQMTITNKYGSSASGSAVSGLVLADFELSEISPTPAPITITSVNESEAGVYNFIIPSETSGDVLELGIASSTKGWDDTLLKTATITIP